MKRLIGIVLIGAMTVSMLSGCTQVVIESKETSETTEEAPVRPQDDYYRYINGDRLKNVEFEYGDTSAGSAFEMEQIDDQIEGIIKDTVAGSGYAKGSEEDIIKTAYNAFIAYDFSNEPIPEDLAKIISDIDNVQSVDELMEIDAMLARDYGLTSILGITVSTNNFVSGENILTIPQQSSVLVLNFEDVRDDSFALDNLADNGKIVMKTLGYDDDTAGEYGKKLALVALDLYGATDFEIMDAQWQFEYMSICSKDEMDNIFTNIDISEYLKTVGFDPAYCDKFCVVDMEQTKQLNSILTDENIDALKTWELGRLYERYMRFIAPHYKEFAVYLTDSYDTLEEQAVNEISAEFFMETDPIYVERYYTQKMDDSLVSMCDDIREGYRKLISDADWLTDGTKKGLLEKLDNIVYITGMDLKRHDNAKYAGLSGNYYQIMLQYDRIQRLELIDSLSKPVDRKENGMPMQMVNACYDPTANSITITVAITNKPFFDPDADYYTNLGGLGSVIAHEMGHAFDSNCIVFDKNGVYNPKWIADADMNVLLERNEKAVKYFEDNFVVFGIYHVDGEQTLGENYADLGGMECVTSLAKTNEDLKKIFENYATIWCMKKVDTAIIDQLAYDEHSPEVIRTNAILSTLDCFYDVYDVKEGDGMYIAPENRISRWY